MNLNFASELTNNNPFQVAWVVSDIQSTEDFFRKKLGVSNFARMENVRAQDTEGIYKGKPGNFEFHLSLSYSGGLMLELIQPVSGMSIYQDFLDKNNRGGVQHIAYSLPESKFESAVSQLKNDGYLVVQSLVLSVARVAYFDTSSEIGIATEIIGITNEGNKFLEQLKNDNV